MLLHELSKHYASENTTNFVVLDFVYAFGSPLEAAAYSKLFWPDFVQHEEMTFRNDVIEDNSDKQRITNALQRYNGDRRKVEDSFNLVEVPSALFGKRSGEASKLVHQELAKTLCEMWHARLNLIYPNRQFVVETDKDENEESTITFYQARE